LEHPERTVQQLTPATCTPPRSAGRRGWLPGVAALALLLAAGCLNPFAPGWDDSPGVSACDPHSIDGIFECFRAAYAYRDTTLYGDLLDPEFVFVYRNYELGIDVTWGRGDEMRSTYGLFQNAQKIDLIWNATASSAAESTRVTVVRSFTLTIVFTPSDIDRIDGFANLTFQRAHSGEPWKILRWRDESNF
jgi:hypothetical protein